MIETYKIVHGIYDGEVTSTLTKASDAGQRHSTRSNSHKIVHKRYKTRIRGHSFSLRVARIWNKLPEKIVTAPSVNAFKNRLDKLWKDEELYYNDYKAEITGRYNQGNEHHIESGVEEHTAAVPENNIS